MNDRTLDQNVAEFKKTVTEDWAGDDTAAAWQKHYLAMRDQMAGVTQVLVEDAKIEPGMSVLDLASGNGQPSIPIAKAVGAHGKVCATDFNPGMLAALKSNAADEGVTNIETHVCDAHDLPFADASFDRVTSRFGAMFFCETAHSLSEVRRVLKPGGRLTFMVWGAPIPGSYFATAVLPFMKRSGQKPDPDGPGPMRYAEPNKLAALYRSAGFVDVTESSHVVSSPYKGTPEKMLADMVEIARPFRSMVESMPADVRRAAEEEAYAAARSIQSDGAINLTSPVIIVSGNAPA
ncbi:MAG TPA: class I SAM-dependent methyltransferase [Fimbriimonadaceae bacterium]|nr:class I SAM-dependent methyltransferase [Fimbriimonadaceae bacterium]